MKMKKVILFWFLAFLLTACGSSDFLDLYTSEPGTTSGDVGPFVETSNIELTATSFYSNEFGAGNDGMLIQLDRGDTKKNLRVGSHDILIVAVNGVPQFIEEVKNVHCAREFSCSYSYYYRIVFQDNPDGQPLAISLQRTTGVSSQTTVTLPPRPTITAPLSGAVIDLSTDTMNISWQPGLVAEETQLTVSGDCGVYTDLRFTDSRTTHSFAPGTFQFSTAREFCVNATGLPLTLRITRYQDYPADPALAHSSLLQLSITHEVVVQVRP